MRKMKDSGIDWIGAIPEDWSIKKFKYYFDIIGGCGFKEEYQGKETGDFPFCKASDINGKEKTVSSAKNYVDNDLVLSERYSVIPAGSILIAKIGEALKKNHRKINTVPCIVDNNCEAFVPNSECEINYLYYVLKHIDMFWFDNGGTIPSVNNAKLRNFYLPCNDVATQKKISTYLDKKSARLDEIVAKQHEVIGKLNAYKQSIISETVLNGLNPNAETKDSGYDFIGNIPAHWKVCRLRNIGTAQNGISKGGEFFGKGFPFVSYGDVYKNYSLPTKISGLIESTDEERERYSVEQGDIFFTRTSETLEEVGIASVCEETIPDATFAGFLIRVRPFTDELYVGYSKYFFRSNHQRFYLVKEMNLVTRASLGQDLLKSMPVLIPPMEEQTQIADYLDKKCAAIDSSIAKRQQLIDKLTEYKKSLIFEVVTGKKEV